MNQTEWNPASLLELSGDYWQTCTLHAGVALDLFSAIGEDRVTVDVLARKLDSNERGLAMLLNALAAMGLLTKSGTTYANTPEALACLCRDSKDYIGYMISHHHHLAESWVSMDRAVRQGGPLRDRSGVTEEEWRESFLMGMFNIAMANAPAVSRELDLTGCSRLLDLGGGPGTYAIHFCLATPGLEAIVFDQATTRPFAEKTIERFGLADRVGFVPGDYTEGDLPLAQAFDAAWLSHILHGEGPETAGEIVARAAKVMKPGGKLFIHEFILDDTQDGPLFPALFSLNMYLGTEAGQSYSQSELTDMMAAAGFRDITRLPFVGRTQSGILQGIL